MCGFLGYWGKWWWVFCRCLEVLHLLNIIEFYDFMLMLDVDC
jgi:hypothetical protein